MRDLKLLVRDYTPIAKNALTILINLSADQEVLAHLADDDAFLEVLLSKLVVSVSYRRGKQAMYILMEGIGRQGTKCR